MHPVMQLKNAQNCLGRKAKSINVEYKSYGQFHEFKVCVSPPHTHQGAI